MEQVCSICESAGAEAKIPMCVTQGPEGQSSAHTHKSHTVACRPTWGDQRTAGVMLKTTKGESKRVASSDAKYGPDAYMHNISGTVPAVPPGSFN